MLFVKPLNHLEKGCRVMCVTGTHCHSGVRVQKTHVCNSRILLNGHIGVTCCVCSYNLVERLGALTLALNSSGHLRAGS